MGFASKPQTDDAEAGLVRSKRFQTFERGQSKLRWCVSENWMTFLRKGLRIVDIANLIEATFRYSAQHISFSLGRRVWRKRAPKLEALFVSRPSLLP